MECALALEAVFYMASPQIENGYTKLANELLDALCAVSLSSHEWNVVHAIIRKTYGYNKKEDWVTNTQIMKLTGQTQQKVSQAKRRLIEKKIVTENGNKISLNKDYEQWSELPKTVTQLPKTVTKVTENGEHKRQYKDNITKDTSEVPSHDNKSFNMNKYNPLGAEIIKGFESVDPKNKKYYNNTTQRDACDFLIEEYGLQETINRILIVNKTNGMPYFPTITTPVQLRDKWVQLEKAIERARREAGSNSVAF